MLFTYIEKPRSQPCCISNDLQNNDLTKWEEQLVLSGKSFDLEPIEDAQCVDPVPSKMFSTLLEVINLLDCVSHPWICLVERIKETFNYGSYLKWVNVWKCFWVKILFISYIFLNYTYCKNKNPTDSLRLVFHLFMQDCKIKKYPF